MTNNNQKKDENQTKSYKTNKNHQTTKQPKLAKEERSFDSERPKKNNQNWLKTPDTQFQQMGSTPRLDARTGV